MRKTRIFLACLLIMMLFAFSGCGNDDAGTLGTEGDMTDAGQDNGAENRNDDTGNDGVADNADDAADKMTTSGGGANNNQNTDANNNQVNQ